MYNFVDTIEALEGTLLPSEALQLNGEYIENLIDGYRTLHVSGREALSPELTSYETGIRDGSKLQSRRFPARTITVTYQLIAESNEAFREAYNKLGGILNVENARMIFNDEQDKFYIGTPSNIGAVPPGKNAIVGEIEFLCDDPFKYSVLEYEATTSLDDDSILIDYNGTYKAYPVLEADFFSEDEAGADGESEVALTGGGDCGYVAFFTEDEKIIQLGDPDEVDGDNTAAKSQTLVNQTFLSTTSWGTTAKKLWAVNSGVSLPVVAQQMGTVAMKDAGNTAPATPATTSGTLLTAKSDGGAPSFNYKVVAKASGRTANSVKITATVTASLGASSSYFGRGYGLMAYLYIGGAWHGVKLKDTTAYWRGTTAHTVNMSFTVTGLAATTASLTGIKFKVERSDSVGGSAGNMAEKACNNLTIPQDSSVTAEDYYLTASSYGTASGAWHGPAITRTISADAAGVVGATDFTFTYKQKMCMSNGTNATKEMGGFHAYLMDSNGTTVAGVRIVKTAAGKQASLMLFVNGVKVHQVGIDITYNNKYFGSSSKSVKTSTIKKSGGTVSFTIGGYKMTFTDSDIANLAVSKVTFMFEQHSATTPLAYNGLFTAKFVKNNCSTFREIPNKFSGNDVLEADCQSGEIFLNGIASPELGALGNDWEEFYLTPGLNQIGIAYSDWVADGYEPTFKVRYREVFL